MKGNRILSRNKTRIVGPRLESEGAVRLIPGDWRVSMVLVRRRCRMPSLKAKENIARSKASIKNQLTIPTDGILSGIHIRSMGVSWIGTDQKANIKTLNLTAIRKTSFKLYSLPIAFMLIPARTMPVIKMAP